MRKATSCTFLNLLRIQNLYL
ncbi:hypothetical protein WCLP8_2380007 [uncultured Gammaproteobacteria bacterium]